MCTPPPLDRLPRCGVRWWRLCTETADANQLNNSLKPQIRDILTKLAGVGSILAGLETRRAQMDDEIVWLARYVTSD